MRVGPRAQHSYRHRFTAAEIGSMSFHSYSYFGYLINQGFRTLVQHVKRPFFHGEIHY